MKTVLLAGLIVAVMVGCVLVLWKAEPLAGRARRLFRRRSERPSTARHRPDPERTVMFRVPPEVRVGRHAGRPTGRAKVRDEGGSSWPANRESDLEVETRAGRYLMPNAVVMSRWPERLRPSNRRPR